MTTLNSMRFALSAAVLSLTLVSAVPANAEIAKRNVYRDAKTTTVDAGSTAEFAKLYNARQVGTAAAKEVNAASDVQRSMGSTEFGRRVMQSNEFGRRVMQSNEFGRRVMQSNEFGRRLAQ